jgi:GT2 family glycosyltransferase
VDNGSNDGSYEILKKCFGKEPHVTVKKLKKNLGFAKGNNAGIRYARTQLGAENCFVCNSDVIFEETLFDELLAVKESGIGVISPKVYDVELKPQPLSVNTRNPYLIIAFTWLYVLYKSIPECLLREYLVFLQEYLFKPCIKLFKWLYKFYSLIIAKICVLTKLGEKHSKASDSKKYSQKSTSHYQIQGCAFLLTKEYFQFYHQLYPKTFLYGEELNLAVYLKKAGLRGIVAETSPVIHKGKQSSKELSNTEGERKLLAYTRRSLLRSLPLLFLSYSNIKKLY